MNYKHRVFQIENHAILFDSLPSPSWTFAASLVAYAPFSPEATASSSITHTAGGAAIPMGLTGYLLCTICLTMWFEAENQSFRGQYHTNEKRLPPSSAFLGKTTLLANRIHSSYPFKSSCILHQWTRKLHNSQGHLQFFGSKKCNLSKQLDPILNIHIWIQSSHTPLDLSPSTVKKNLSPTNSTSTVSKSSKLAWHSSLKTPQVFPFLFSGDIPSPSCCSLLFDPNGNFRPSCHPKIHGNSWSFVTPHVLFSFILYKWYMS